MTQSLHDFQDLPGQVAAVYTDKYLVWCKGGDRVCTLKGRLRGDDRPVVGDWVRILAGEEGQGVIHTLEPRRTMLRRPQPNRKNMARAPAQLLAANMDQLVVVSAVNHPPFRFGLVDRFLVAAARAGLAPLLCVTKLDLDDAGEAAAIVSAYEPAGIPVVLVSEQDAPSLEPLRRALAGHTSVLVGHSGVGKSTLINLLTGERQSVGGVDARSQQGRHTTSTAQLFALRPEGYLIDSPGIREFGLTELVKADLAAHFPGFSGHIGACGFRDCLHHTEPRCGIRQAVENGSIAERRYQGYLNLLEELPLD